MMIQKREFGYGQDVDLQILEMPYLGDLAMVVLVPRAVDGLAKLEASLTTENVRRWTERLRPMEVEVSLPRFAVSSAFRLDEALQALGMVDAFTGCSDFSAMSREPAYISAVLHKAFVTVGEEGTEAAAATAVVMKMRSVQTAIVRADHPFLFLIRENSTHSILFVGRVVDPTAGG
jgi:serpin B